MTNAKEARLENWVDLVAAARKNEAKLPGTASLVSSLAGARSQILTLSARRDSLMASAQGLTQEVNQALAEAAEVASRLRSTIKGILGIHTEELLRYGIQPIRRRPRKAAPPATTPTA